MSDKIQSHSKECLDLAARYATAADVPVQTQTRLAVNFVTATVHAFHENNASEVLIGMHRKRSDDGSFFGMFATGLVDKLSRQITIVSMTVPANTIRNIVVAVPEKAEFEKGFYRWINRIARIAEDLGCTITFYATEATNQLIFGYMKERHKAARSEYELLESWNDFTALRHELNDDSLFVVVTARMGSISYQSSFTQIPQQIQSCFANNSLMIIYPDQMDESNDMLVFADPHNIDRTTPPNKISQWLSKWIGEMG